MGIVDKIRQRNNYAETFKNYFSLPFFLKCVSNAFCVPIKTLVVFVIVGMCMTSLSTEECVLAFYQNFQLFQVF
jgi:hypothetical protein